MIQQGKDLKDLSVIELKARVYDLLSVKENMELQIRETVQLIAQKSRPEPIKEE